MSTISILITPRGTKHRRNPHKTSPHWLKQLSRCFYRHYQPFHRYSMAALVFPSRKKHSKLEKLTSLSDKTLAYTIVQIIFRSSEKSARTSQSRRPVCGALGSLGMENNSKHPITRTTRPTAGCIQGAYGPRNPSSHRAIEARRP